MLLDVVRGREIGKFGKLCFINSLNIFPLIWVR